MPVYNGGLFITDPDPDDEGAEATTARFLSDNRIPDRHLALGLDLMARDLDEKTQGLVPIDYKSLGVRQLGSIYEGLLEFKVRVAERNLCVVKEKGSYKYKPKGELTKAQREKLSKARATTVQQGPRKGDVYLENDKRERKATGSYYTPDYIVKYIVEHTVGPVLEEKFGAVRPKLRQAEMTFGALCSRVGAVDGYSRKDAAREAFERHKTVVDELFDVKVLDPAMGSGHFLVEAVDFITDRMIDFLNAFPWNPVRELLEQTRRTIQEEMDEQEVNIDPGRLTDVNLLKRHVLKRCVYGVDLNPMAVELAKVSLWLDCFTLGAPLSFLDHHLRCGNSLIGTDVETVKKGVEGTEAGKGIKQMSLMGSIFTGLERATEAMAHVGKLTDTTVEQVHDSVRHYRTAQKLLAPYKGLLDVWVSQWFGNEDALDAFHLYPDQVDKAVKAAVKEDGRPNGVSEDVWDLVTAALDIAQDRRFFHWELEFPETWHTLGQRQTRAGFDCVCGNPPYDVVNETPYHSLSVAAGTGNLFAHFIARGIRLTTEKGGFGFVVPLAFSCGSSCEALRQVFYKRFAQMRATHYSIRPAKLFPGVDQRVTIFTAHGSSDNGCEVFSSRLYRFREGEQSNVVLNPDLGRAGRLSESHIPRVGDATGASIYAKLRSLDRCVQDYATEQGPVRWYYHSVGRYWLKAYDFLPYFRRDGVLGISTNLRTVLAPDETVAQACVALINSDLFYFWWMTQSDEFHLLGPEVLGMPMPETLTGDKEILRLEETLMDDYRANAVRKTIRAGGALVEMDEIHARKSNEIIHQIDEALRCHYGLTEQEVDWLEGFDDRFRIGDTSD